jgi:glycosyltransferase involved in cell wall biosynthesis
MNNARKHDDHDPISFTIILPVRDEASSLRELHANLIAVLQQLPGEAEIIYVDDGSGDGSFDIIAGLAERDHCVRGVQLRQHYGKSAALAAGFERARGDVVVTLDADLQDDPREIPRLLETLDGGYDLVCGWRQERADPWHKRAASWLFNRITTMLVNLPLHDLNGGLKVFRREVAKEIRLYGELHRFFPVLAARQGFRVGEAAVVHHPRKYGHSKYGLGRGWAGAVDLLAVTFLTRYNTRPLQFFGVPGLLCFLVGIGVSAWLAWGWLFLDMNLSNRPLLFLGILLIIVGIQFLSLGLLGEMITAAHADRLHYSVRQEIG